MPIANMPPAEVSIDAGLVKTLVAAQFPEYADLPIRPVAGLGWDNTLYRLGSNLVVRLPRRQFGADLVEKEHRYLLELAPRLPVPIPVPLARGWPGQGFPWQWSICPWFDGELAALASIKNFTELAGDLARFIMALHAIDVPDGAPVGWRHGPLAAHDAVARRRLTELSQVLDVEAASAAWEAAVAVPAWSGPSVWLHGDLHPANLLINNGRLVAVLDFGDLAVGDPAVDLMSAWALLPLPPRRHFRELLGVDDATWARGRGWALYLGLACLASSADNPVIAGVGRRAVNEVLGEQGET